MNKTVNHLTVNGICENGVAGHAVPPRQNRVEYAHTQAHTGKVGVFRIQNRENPHLPINLRTVF